MAPEVIQRDLTGERSGSDTYSPNSEISLSAGTQTVTLTEFICIDPDETDDLEHVVFSLDLSTARM